MKRQGDFITYKGRKRKVFVGPQGGEYVISGGQKRFLKPEEEEVTEQRMLLTQRQRGKLAQANYLVQQPVEMIQMIAKQANTWTEARNIYLAAGLQPPTLRFAVNAWKDKIKTYTINTAIDKDVLFYPHQLGTGVNIFRATLFFNDVPLIYTLQFKKVGVPVAQSLLEYKWVSKELNNPGVGDIGFLYDIRMGNSILFAIVKNKKTVEYVIGGMYQRRRPSWHLIEYSNKLEEVFRILFFKKGKIRGWNENEDLEWYHDEDARQQFLLFPQRFEGYWL